MAPRQEQAVNVEEGDGEVIDLGSFDLLKENNEVPKPKPEILLTAFTTGTNGGDDEIKEEKEIEDEDANNNTLYSKDVDKKMRGGESKRGREVKRMETEEEDTNVEIERVMMEETMCEEKMEGSLPKRNEKRGFFKKIIEKWA